MKTLQYGRVEVYLHSDITTQNKGGCLVKVNCASEPGSRTDEFKAFCKQTAMLCYGAGCRSWKKTIEIFPALEENRLALQNVLKEPIKITKIATVTL
jgi:translation elongation factor EF-Ts